MMFWWFRNLKLQPLLTRNVDNATLHEMYNLWRHIMAGTVSYTDFLEVHMSFENTLLMRDLESNRICGVTVYSVIPTDLKNKSKNIWILRTGPAYIQPQYQRKHILHDFTIYSAMKERFRHPLVSLYMTVNFVSYKGYPGFVKFSEEAYPRYDKATPELEKKIIDYFVFNVLKLGETYDSERSTVQIQQSIKEEFAGITEESLQNPHIKFYTEMNPHWLKGYAMIGIVEVAWKFLFSKILELLLKQK